MCWEKCDCNSKRTLRIISDGVVYMIEVPSESYHEFESGYFVVRDSNSSRIIAAFSNVFSVYDSGMVKVVD